MSTASTAKPRDPDLDVVAFDTGPYTSFSACGIAFYVSGIVERSDGLIARSPEEHRKNGIAVHLRTEVLSVDLRAREVTVRDAAGAERREGFDQLVLATGAEAVDPPVPGAERAEPARTIPEAKRLKASLEPGTGRLLGGQIVGTEGAAKRIDVLALAVWNEMAVDELALLDLAYAPPYSGVYDPLLVAAGAAAKVA
ncbi:MAG: FAD-dependent oxidoreductase [Actinomycetota bacterium]|nr:FAD-dependent oxidoreductase [Actinomycetota bacterium]